MQIFLYIRVQLKILLMQSKKLCLLGIPIIATYAGGLSSVIDNNITGILVNEGDPYVLAGAIVEMLENYDEAISMGTNARKIALDRHNPQKVVNELLNIYKIILNEQK